MLGPRVVGFGSRHSKADCRRGEKRGRRESWLKRMEELRKGAYVTETRGWRRELAAAQRARAQPAPCVESGAYY